MSTKITISNSTSQIIVDGQIIGAGVSVEAPAAGYTLMTASDLSWTAQEALLSWRNKIINGDMAVDQRNNGASISVVPSSFGFCADRWLMWSAGATQTAQRVSVSDLPGFAYGIRANFNTGGTDYSFTQRVEAANMVSLVGKTATVSLWVFNGTGASASFNYNFAYPNVIDNYNANTSYAASSYSIPAGWSKQIINVNIPQNCVNGSYFAFSVTMSAVGHYYILTGVQVEAGTVATPFEYVPYSESLNLCKRYYSKYNAASTSSAFGSGCWATTTQGWVYLKYDQRMRSAPTVVLTGITLSNGTPKTYSSTGSVYPGTDGVLFAVNTSTTALANNGAILIASLSSGSVALSSEL